MLLISQNFIPRSQIHEIQYSPRYQFTYCYLFYSFTYDYLFLLPLTLIIPQRCYVCLVSLINTIHTDTDTDTHHTHCICIQLYTVRAATYAQFPSLIQYTQTQTQTHTHTHCICIQLYTVRAERKRRPPAVIKSLAQVIQTITLHLHSNIIN